MSLKLVSVSAVVFAMGTLLSPGSAPAQFANQVKVSDAIEGNPIPGLSAARCGTNIVVGFADTEGAPPGTTAAGPGFAVSNDGGQTFSDLGVLPDRSLTFGDDGGSNVIGCSSASTFYYATRGFIETAEGPCIVGCTEISLSKSTDGGRSWSASIAASTGTSDNYDFHAPSLAVDPTNPNHMYIAYLNFNGAPSDFSDCGGGEPDSIILEFVSSSDGGKTWSGRANPAEFGTPSMELDHSCPNTGTDPAREGTLSSPNVLVSPGGKVYLTYAFTGTDPSTGLSTGKEIRFVRSLDAGKTFSAPIKVSTDAVNNAAPRLGVDRTTDRSRGTIYLAWSGKPNGAATEVLMSESLDLGLSFSFPRSVRGTSQGTQINPVVAVDNDGQVATCYYVTGTNTPTSSSNYFYNCLTSFNHAATWTAYQKLVTSAPPGFDALTSDFLLHNDGFFTAFEVSASGQSHVVGAKSDN